jgi:hypothetical protein
MNTTLMNELNELVEKKIQYLDEISRYSIYSLNDFVVIFDDPSVFEWIDVKEFVKRKKIIRKLFERYIKEFLKDNDYEISLPFFDNGVYWFYVEIKNCSEMKSFRIIKSKKENFIRDSVVILTKLAEYYLYLTKKKFIYGITWSKYNETDIVKLKIESLPFDLISQSCLLKIMSNIRDLGTDIEYDF